MAKLSRRKILHLTAGIAALPALPRIARAQTYPTRSVLLLVGYAPGGPTDICARLISQSLSQRLGQQFVVENRSGAGSNIATEAAVQAAPDGYTLLLVTSSNAINATLYRNLNFDFMRDIAPIAGIMQAPSVLEVNPSLPIKSVPEFIAYAKTNPGKVNMGTAGNGSPPHMFGELFKAMAGVDLAVVGYRGGGPALVDLLSGQVQVMFEGITSSIGYIRAGKLRALAVTSAKRSTALPDIPTIGEFVPGYAAAGWFGLGAPKGTPQPIIDMLSKAIGEALADPEMKARFADLGAEAMPMTPAEFGNLVADDTQKWAKVIRSADIKLD
ncbi:MAG TPA: tripartite tricarboxylate transporter substrate binding protein [Xanthobacteraceae bacterium]|nr:tripartite tricarboxylate transporter substrate binding protein [Xanthobacteraceae bacterium]